MARQRNSYGVYKKRSHKAVLRRSILKARVMKRAKRNAISEKKLATSSSLVDDNITRNYGQENILRKDQDPVDGLMEPTDDDILNTCTSELRTEPPEVDLPEHNMELNTKKCESTGNQPEEPKPTGPWWRQQAHQILGNLESRTLRVRRQSSPVVPPKKKKYTKVSRGSVEVPKEGGEQPNENGERVIKTEADGEEQVAEDPDAEVPDDVVHNAEAPDDEDLDDEESDDDDSDAEETLEAQVKRKPGRPRGSGKPAKPGRPRGSYKKRVAEDPDAEVPDNEVLDDEDSEDEESDDDDSDAEETLEPQVKRKPGRPRGSYKKRDEDPDHVDESSKVKRPRGRPRGSYKKPKTVEYDDNGMPTRGRGRPRKHPLRPDTSSFETRLMIVRVYRFLEKEYESMKMFHGDHIDLSPLSDILQRTASATGVSTQNVSWYLRQEEKRQAILRERRWQMIQKRTEIVYEADDPGVVVKEEEGVSGMTEMDVVQEPVYQIVVEHIGNADTMTDQHNDDNIEPEQQYPQYNNQNNLYLEVSPIIKRQEVPVKNVIPLNEEQETTSAVHHLLCSTGSVPLKVEEPDPLDGPPSSSLNHHVEPDTSHVTIKTEPVDDLDTLDPGIPDTGLPTTEPETLFVLYTEGDT